MKKYLLTAMTVICSAMLFAQEIPAEKVPSEVKTAFQSKFPDAKKVEWEMEDGLYEAEFKMKGNEMSATFDSKGIWKETETEIKVKNLPKAVSNMLANEFPGFEIDEACQVESAEHGSCYEVEIEKGDEEMEVLLKADGTILKKEMSKDESDD